MKEKEKKVKTKPKTGKEKKKKEFKFKWHPTKDFIQGCVWIAVISIFSFIIMGKIFGFLLTAGIIGISLFSILINKLRKYKPMRIIINGIAILFLLGCLAGVGAVAWFLSYVVQHAPDFNPDNLYKSQTSIIYDNKGKEVMKMGTEKRETITYDQLNEALVDAIVATEDSRFFTHSGLDPIRFLKASIQQALGMKNAGGASTLTMQISKTVYTDTTSRGFEGIVRKFTDIYLSVFKIEKEFSKEEIMEFYVNIPFLGSNSAGVEAAAQTYFNKSAKDLNLAETALIAGLFQSPSENSPLVSPEKAEKRRQEVLNLMERHGYITHEENEIASSIPVKSLLTTSTTNQVALSYILQVMKEAKNKYGINPNNTSVLIYTNLDLAKQKKLDDIFSGKSYKWENPVVQAGVAAVDVWTGKIIALGAGRNRVMGGVSYATDTSRQIGSTAKPLFDYGPGIEYNNWSTYQQFDDSPYQYSSGQEIRNSDRGYMGMISLRTALAQSRNIPALKAFQQVDNKKIFNFVKSLGLTLEKESEKSGYLHEAYSIGAFNGSNPLQMAAAYAAFANGGYYIEPYTISKIVFRDTGEVITYTPEKKRVMSDATAYMITDCLKSAVTDGLSSVAAVKGVNVAAKTGTTNYPAEVLKAYGLPSEAANDAWVIGYSPDVAIGLWYGYEPISKKYYTTNNSAAIQRRQLFNAVGNIMFTKDNKDFAVPKSVKKLPVEIGSPGSGYLASEYTPESQITYEYFKVGSEPKEPSTTYVQLSNPSNLKVTYDPTTLTVNLSWNKATQPENTSSDFGAFGYRIYKDNKQVAFTTNTSYTISNVVEPAGVYKVVTSYKKYTKNDSPGITYTLEYQDTSNYEYKFKDTITQNKTYMAGEQNPNSFDITPSKDDIILLKDGADVTSSATVTIAITDSSGTDTHITTDSENTFTIKYTINYSGKTFTLTRTVTIKASTTSPDPGGTTP